jgi:hypothetical protein
MERAIEISQLCPESKKAAKELNLDDRTSALLEIAKEKSLEAQVKNNVIVLRTWWKDEDGEEHPGRDGITLDVSHVTKLARAFKRARKRAKEEGLIDES